LHKIARDKAKINLMKVFNQIFWKTRNNKKLKHHKKEIQFRINFNKRLKAHKEGIGNIKQNKML
jgi:hypothetical protein